MRIRNLMGIHSGLALVLAVGSLLVLSACNIHVKKDQYGKDKKVDIDTPLGGIHVSKNADVRDTGLSVYPGSKAKEKGEDGNTKSANVNISSGSFGLKVVALEYESNDAPEKIIAYYKDQLKKYGNVLECHTSNFGNAKMNHNSGDSGELKCDDDPGGKNIELKVGTENNQHIVSIKPRDKGTDFALVLVRVHGKDTI